MVHHRQQGVPRRAAMVQRALTVDYHQIGSGQFGKKGRIASPVVAGWAAGGNGQPLPVQPDN